MTPAEAVSSDRRAITLHIDEICANLADRTCPGFVLLARLQQWIAKRALPKEK